MSLADTVTFKPVARTDHLERLAALSGEPALTTGLWGDLHGEIQKQFALLEAEVVRKVPGVQVDTGRTQGERFFLFSYRTFSLPHSTVDPVVAGITFMPVGDDVTVEADVSGEQMGDWIASVPRQTVANSRNTLLKAAIASARELLQSADLIVVALTNTSRNVA